LLNRIILIGRLTKDPELRYTMKPVYIIHPYRGKKGEYKANMGWKNQRDKNGHWEDVCPECAGV
jgi:hypothetical protein